MAAAAEAAATAAATTLAPAATSSAGPTCATRPCSNSEIQSLPNLFGAR